VFTRHVAGELCRTFRANREMRSSHAANSCPAVVIGGELNGLGVCRSLGEGDVSTYVLDPHCYNPAMWSRHATPVKARKLYGPSLLEALKSLQIRLGGRPVLIATDEMALLTISEHRDQLNGLFRFRLPAPSTVMMLHNKAQFHEYALENDFPVPNGEVIRQQSDVRRICRLRYPVFIKPADKRAFHLGTVARLVVAGDCNSAMRIAERSLEAAGEVVVQECIEGPDSGIYFCLFYRASGGARVMFTGRKLASSPHGVGSTAYCIQARDMAPHLECVTNALLERVDYEGFGGVEYKWDSRRDRFVIIEPTVGRTDWQAEIATLCGTNIPLAGYRNECDLPPVPPEPIKPVVWQGSFVERIKVGINPAKEGAAIVDGYWRADDPLPALVHYPRDLLLSTPAMASALAHRGVLRLITPLIWLRKRGLPAPEYPSTGTDLRSEPHMPGHDIRT
jgi:D-aspartate ligase